MVELAGVPGGDAAATATARSGRLAAAGDAEAGAAAAGVGSGGGGGKRLTRLESAPRNASKRYLLSNQLMDPTGDWKTVAWLIVTVTALPVLLSLPYAVAALSWAGGVITLAVSSGAWLYCGFLLVNLHEHPGPPRRRLTRYRDITRTLLGPHWRSGPTFFLGLQFAIVVGACIALIILSGQILQFIYTSYCTGDCGIGLSVWIIVAGAIQLPLSQLPDMGSMDALTALAVVFCALYCVVAVVLSIVDGGGRGADYSIAAGSPVERTFRGFTAVGIILFNYGQVLFPEIQATVAPSPKPPHDSIRPMVTGLLAAFALIVALYTSVGLVGYWAYGNTVASFLLFMPTSCRWLVTTVLIMAVLQGVVGIQAYSYMCFEALELWLLQRFPHATWMQSHHSSSGAGASGRAVVVPSRALLLVERSAYVVFLTFVACTFPFFGDIMGFVGAAGFGPLTFLLPIVLHLIANGKSEPAWKWWAHVGLAALMGAAVLAAAIGSLYQIVQNAANYEFYS